MPEKKGLQKLWTDVFYSFPVQLLILHIRSNHLLLGIWVLLALFMTGVIGKSFGIRYLFLDPEYLGEVNPVSFLLVGLAFGVMYMSWNLTVYLLSTHHFPFLASLKRPFTKFCLNNSLIPLGFFVLYLIYAGGFQADYEFWPLNVIAFNLLAFLGGVVITILLYSLYFQLTNKDISNFEKVVNRILEKRDRGIPPGRSDVDIEEMKQDKNRWRVDTYLNETLRPRAVRSVEHYDNKIFLGIFKQNHKNALVVQLASILILLLLGRMMDYPVFRIPAGASIFILASIFVAMVGAVNYWLHEWRATIVILMLIGLNYLSKIPYFNYPNRAYGLTYTEEKSPYSVEEMAAIGDSATLAKDIAQTLEVLNNWRSKFGEANPKMVITTVSGGGLKASVWTMNVLQKADSLTSGKMMDNSVLFTGASGGMIGASYFRELYLRHTRDSSLSPYKFEYLESISKDLLNSVAFSIVSNDLFMPLSYFDYEGKEYVRDRGYIFERQFNENTASILDKPLHAYREPELKGQIPMLIVSPSIVNDARRMLISPLGVSYLTGSRLQVTEDKQVEYDAVDFRRIYGAQGADSLRFTTALRMNATYPYILPNVHLPSEPEIEVMDAGFRDNLGLLSATRFLQVFKNWILENTSGVVLIQISSIKEHRDIPPSNNQGFLESLSNPLGILGHIIRLQDFERDANLGFVYDILGQENLDIVRFHYLPGPEAERASMTFHLTRREKTDIITAFDLPFNQESLRQLQTLLAASSQAQ
ncbi:MAG: patatin-like phospholipase family protein [Saprospiraceae bacterium]|nr:patatin-like phospholipase family protein [Saprospiraceae bacterium]